MESIAILLVEDEALIHVMVEESLTEAGFSVSIAGNGKDALQMLAAPDAAYRALVTDIDLGSKDIAGWDVARRAREINPDLPVVYMTGGGDQEWASQGVPNSVLVTKPFATAQVVTAVSQLLNQGNTPGS